ncbi:NADP oxidoreductase [Streptomyces parvulus]|uniref:NADP oxidoreductase n=1 Tax=Streptomyces parvulus TaxID=146923 RepID=A0A369UUH6_9ACTN|nr:NADP oxidoreductase [Streptomyces parvulus]
MRTVGILGAGKFGLALARLALAASYRVLVAGSRDPERITSRVGALASGAQPVAVAEVIRADVVILALPFRAHRSLPVAGLRGKLVVDAMNRGWDADGADRQLPGHRSSSEMVQAHLSGARLVKAFNHVGYHELEDDALPGGAEGRKAMAMAGDDPHDLGTVGAMIRALGFDPIVAGPLKEGARFEPGTKPFGARASAEELCAMLDRPRRGSVVPRAERTADAV